jgi:nucleoside-diphosphate-sugar epimerase
MGSEPPPPELSGHWDVIVHTAASTRWTMSRAEALAADVDPLRAVLSPADADTHVVHVSTAYVARSRAQEDLRGPEFEGYRNGYEWSKAACESLVREDHAGPLTIVRPPLIVGRRDDGRIARFSGPYTIIHALVSGLAAVVVRDPDGYAEISPVDEVAEAVASAVRAAPPAAPRVEVVAGGAGSLRLSDLIGIACRTLNEFRARHGVAGIEQPPFVPPDTWNRFFLPLANQYLSPFQANPRERSTTPGRSWRRRYVTGRPANPAWRRHNPIRGRCSRCDTSGAGDIGMSTRSTPLTERTC